MTKVLYIVSTLSRCGPTNQLFNIIKYLDRDRFEPYLITLSPEPKDSRWDDYKKLGVKLYSLNLSRFSGFFFSKNNVSKIVNEIKPDLIHTQGIRADSISSSLKSTLPKICTVRNFPQEDYVMTYGKLKGYLMVYQHVKAFRKLACCVGVSQAVEKNLKDKFDIIKTDSITNGVDTEIYLPAASEEKEKLREKHRIPQESNIWISSGHLSVRKDPIFLINQWKSNFANDLKNILLFIGDGDLHDECLSLASETNNIRVLGRVNNVSDFLQASDYFVSASKAEGLPNTVIEALACGLPVLLSNIGPHREIFDMDEKIGSLFTLNDEHMFSVGVAHILAQPKENISASALRLAKQRLSAKKMSDRYQELYFSHIKT